MVVPWPSRAARAGEGSAKENDRVVSDLIRSIVATHCATGRVRHEHDVTDAK